METQSQKGRPKGGGNKSGIPKRADLVIPGAEFMTEEELAKARKNEYQRMQMAIRRGKQSLERETKQEVRIINTSEMVELSKNTRNIAIQTLNKKLIELYHNPEELNKINLAQLATVFGILFDKTQLLSGLSTENIAVTAKIDINMTSDKALQELNKMRERYSEDNS